MSTKDTKTDKPSIIWRFWRWLHPRCPKCKDGKLWYKEIYWVGMGIYIDVYECDRCKKTFV